MAVEPDIVETHREVWCSLAGEQTLDMVGIHMDNISSSNFALIGRQRRRSVASASSAASLRPPSIRIGADGPHRHIRSTDSHPHGPATYRSENAHRFVLLADPDHGERLGDIEPQRDTVQRLHLVRYGRIVGEL